MLPRLERRVEEETGGALPDIESLAMTRGRLASGRVVRLAAVGTLEDVSGWC